VTARPWLAAIGRLLAPYVAKDTFRDGGDLVDVDGLTAGRDKVVHFVCGGMLWFAMWGMAPLFGLAGVDLSLRARILLMLFFVTAWECFELARYLQWSSRGRPQPWPWACDQFSWRDIVAGLAGAALFQLPILAWAWLGR
jgi:hypothetical protein